MLPLTLADLIVVASVVPVIPTLLSSKSTPFPVATSIESLSNTGFASAMRPSMIAIASDSFVELESSVI